jgi:outer membrane immunogenic protein
MILKALLSGTAISTLSVVTAFAQAPGRAPAPQPFSWTGFYLGGHFGTTKHHASTTDAIDWLTTFAAAPGMVYDTSERSWSYGFQGGFNYQWNYLVAGIEGDIGFTSSERRIGFPALPATITSSFSQLATVRGRAGFAIDRVMVYGTAGWAFADLVNRVDETPNPFTAARGTSPTGIVFGGGVEYAFQQNWTMRFEYLRANFKDEIVNAVGPGATYQFAFRDAVDVARLGINYKF